MHIKNVIMAGKPLPGAAKALVLIHGRGAAAHDMLGLAKHFSVSDFALAAPQATGNSWYPYSFLAARESNEPWLSSALQTIAGVVDDLVMAGVDAHNIFFLGFSQGACLATEFIARNPNHYGGAAIFTGGLIGDFIHEDGFVGDLSGMPVFMGSGDPDSHVPAERVIKSAAVLQRLNANVTLKIYNGMAHTITDEEISVANDLLFRR